MARLDRARPATQSARMVAQDVLLIVFDDFTLSELLTLSLACRHWRAAARNHPTFWRSVALTKATRGAVDFFIARLKQSDKAVVSVTVRPPPLLAGLVRSIADAIAMILDRVRTLSIDFTAFPASQLQTVMRALENPAPVLEQLALCTDLDKRDVVFLRQKLFSLHAPKLRRVSVDGIDLTRTPSAFAQTTDLQYSIDHDKNQPHVQKILEQHPNLKRLHLTNLSYIPLSLSDTVQLGALRTLQLEYANGRFDGRIQQFQDLQTVSISNLSRWADENDAFFAHLNGPLHLHIAVSDWDVAAGCFRLELRDTSGDHPRRARAVEQLRLSVLLSSPSPQPAGGLASRVTSAYIPVGLLEPVGYWLGNRAAEMRELRVYVDHHTDKPINPSLVCPQLQHLTLVGGPSGRTMISTKDINSLLTSMNAMSTATVILEEIVRGGPTRFFPDEAEV